MSTIDETDVYHISNWSNDYFSKDKLGNVAVNLPELEKSFPLKKLTDQARAQGLQFPLLVRFPHILHERVRLLTQAFEAAIEDYEYSGRYTPIYPIKVNQQRRVVEEIDKARIFLQI